MIIDVTKPYAGAATGRKLRITRHPSGDGEFALLDMRSPGRRVLDAQATPGAAAPGDAVTGLGSQPFSHVRFINEAATPVPEQRDVEPVWTCLIMGEQV